MNTPELCEWQRIDPDNGICEPWWTWPCMDVIKTWDLSQKRWLEFGSGLSTTWLRSKCKEVMSVEANIEWGVKALAYCKENNLDNGAIWMSPINDGVAGGWESYQRLIPELHYDIISVDGIYRNECLEWALNHFKGRGGILVVDNMDQDYVWKSPAADELMAPYKCEIYYQPGHTNHEGSPWNTRIFTIPA